jgi:hypothetical protein
MSDQGIPDFPSDQALQYGASPGADVVDPNNPPTQADTTNQNICVNFCFDIDGQHAPWPPIPFCAPSIDGIRLTVEQFIQQVLQNVPELRGRTITARTC